MTYPCSKKYSWILPFLFFSVAFLMLPLLQMQGLTQMPGDIGDSRLNNYFLENIYLFFAGKSDSLWHLGFFYPLPYVGGFSDNLFGTSPVYIAARLLTGEPDTAFQLWFLAGYAANFTATYYALRRLDCSPLAASAGALIFSFALPTSSHTYHVQLHYRFGIPLAITFFVLFLNKKNFHFLIISGCWLTWQFYAGIYMGFFCLFFLVSMLVPYFLYCKFIEKKSIFQELKEYTTQWIYLKKREKRTFIISAASLLVALVVLFFPYLQTMRLYEGKRLWGEIATMLPRPQSYFLADYSSIWSPVSKLLHGIPMRHEHQMFMGLIPMLLAIGGIVLGSCRKNGQSYALLLGAMGFVIVMTLSVKGFSLWYFAAKLPLASAIRAMTRLDQMLLFPIAYCAGIAIDGMRRDWRKSASTAVVILAISLLVLECTAVSMHLSSKAEWRKRLAVTDAMVPADIPRDSILFFAQKDSRPLDSDIDAMWVSLNRGVKTLNGYSSQLPPRYAFDFNDNCHEMLVRIFSYLHFSKQAINNDAYGKIAQRVIPIGFSQYNPEWLTALPVEYIPRDRRDHTPEEIRNLSYSLVKKFTIDGRFFIRIRIHNAGPVSILPLSMQGHALKLSWRSANQENTPTESWDTRRMELFKNIPPHRDLEVDVPVNLADAFPGGYLEISLVQEQVFWAHDAMVGVAPLRIAWDDLTR